MFDNKTILITGGTGSFGKKYVQVLLEKFKPNSCSSWSLYKTIFGFLTGTGGNLDIIIS